MYKYLFFFALCLTIQQAAATSQDPERIIIGRDTCDLATTPFKMLDSAQYAKFRKLIHKKNFHNGISVSCSTLWRDYTATWELRNDSLLFQSIENTQKQPINVNGIIAPGNLAEWFSGELLVRSGESLWSEDDYGFWESEYETVYTVRNGRVTRRQDYLCRTDSAGMTVKGPRSPLPEKSPSRPTVPQQQ